ncbi:hypothetical protein GGU11DRAFT_750688 [Lentinula aff. detonsa]|nr:hypothetical protein GGU11DRAFT_750688 [Lentinula aff. detonsa]
MVLNQSRAPESIKNFDCHLQWRRIKSTLSTVLGILGTIFSSSFINNAKIGVGIGAQSVRDGVSGMSVMSVDIVIEYDE